MTIVLMKLGQPLFKLGRVVATPAALAALEQSGDRAAAYLDRHHAGDWGNLCDDDKRANDAALIDGSRILSDYTLTDGTNIWIITEWDRSYTTVLLPEDY